MSVLGKQMVIPAFAFSILAGCYDESPTDEIPVDRIATTTSDLTVTGSEWPLAQHGGTGGGNPQRVGCASDAVMIGLYGDAGNYVDRIGFYCARFNEDGNMVDFDVGPEVGGSGESGARHFSRFCPANGAMVGIYGRSHTYLDQINLVCATPPFSSEFRSYVTGGGGGGGDSFVDYCPLGYALNSLVLKWGSWIDRVQGICTFVAP